MGTKQREDMLSRTASVHDAGKGLTAEQRELLRLRLLREQRARAEVQLAAAIDALDGVELHLRNMAGIETDEERAATWQRALASVSASRGNAFGVLGSLHRHSL